MSTKDKKQCRSARGTVLKIGGTNLSFFLRYKKNWSHCPHCFVLSCCVNIFDFNDNKIKKISNKFKHILAFAVKIIKTISLWDKIIVKSLIQSNKYRRKESSSKKFSLILDKMCLLEPWLQFSLNKYIFLCNDNCTGHISFRNSPANINNIVNNFSVHKL